MREGGGGGGREEIQHWLQECFPCSIWLPLEIEKGEDTIHRVPFCRGHLIDLLSARRCVSYYVLTDG